LPAKLPSKLPLFQSESGSEFSYTAGGTLYIGGQTQSSEFSYTAGGTLYIGGQTQAPEITNLGVLVLGGSATVNADLIFAHTATGGLVIGGAVGVAFSLTYAGSGTLTLSGSATVVISLTESATGGLAIGGSAGVLINYAYGSSGSLTLGGTATQPGGFYEVDLFGVVIIDSADVRFALTYSGSGSLIISGSVSVSVVRNTYETTGGLAVGGSAGFQIDVSLTVSGSLILGGQAGIVASNFTYTATGSGGVVTGSAAVATNTRNVDASGNIIIDGQGSVFLRFPYIGSGSFNSFTDSFGRGSSTNVNEWVENSGDWKIEGQKLKLTDLSTLAVATKKSQTDRANYYVQAKVSAASASPIGIVARYQDDNNFYGLYLNFSNSMLELLLRSSGSFFPLGSVGVSVSVGQEYTIRLQIFDTNLRAFFNDTLMINTSDDTISAAGQPGISYRTPT